MRKTTSRLLYNYWNSKRGGRIAPQRFEIEPMKIAPLLPETFILECGGLLGFRFRLAGTRICEQIGRELRGDDFRHLWSDEDRAAVEKLLSAVVTESAVAAIRFEGYTEDGRPAAFELVLLPLIHLGTNVNRIMGSITAVDAPYWLGSRPLTRLAVRALDLDWPGRRDSTSEEPLLSIFSGRQSTPIGGPRQRFRVYDGGLSAGEK